jgi:hypothetical protein
MRAMNMKLDYPTKSIDGGLDTMLVHKPKAVCNKNNGADTLGPVEPWEHTVP